MRLRKPASAVNIRRPVLVGVFLAAVMLPIQAAHAYVGPGAGFAVLSSFLFFFVAFALVGLILLATPIRLLWRLFVRVGVRGATASIRAWW